MRQTVIIVGSTLAMGSQAVLLTSQGFFDSVTKAAAQVVPTEAISTLEAAANGDVQGAIGGAATIAADQAGGQAGQIIATNSDAGLNAASAVATGDAGAITQSVVDGSGNIVSATGYDGAGQMISGVSDLAASDVLNMQSGNIDGVVNDSTAIFNQLSGGQAAVVPLTQATMVQPQAQVQQAVVPQQQQAVIPQQQAVIPQQQAVVPQQQAVVPQQQAVIPQQQAVIPQQQAVIPQQQQVLQASPVMTNAVAGSTLVSPQNGVTQFVTTQAASGLLPGVYTLTVV